VSSLKYIFVIEGNALVRKPKEEINEQTVPGEEKESFKSESGFRETEGIPSETPSSKPRNKRNKTSRGQ
jgi:hypothetical protein